MIHQNSKKMGTNRKNGVNVVNFSKTNMQAMLYVLFYNSRPYVRTAESCSNYHNHRTILYGITVRISKIAKNLRKRKNKQRGKTRKMRSIKTPK